MVALPAAAQEEPVIAEIIVEGGITLTVDTVAYYLGLEPGDPLDQAAVAEGFRRLWESGLFEDIRVEVEPVSDTEVNMYVIVKERPFVTSVVFEGNKKINTSTLKDKLDEIGIELPRNVPLRMASLSYIQSILKEIYDAQGYRSAEVSFRVEETGKRERRVVFEFNEGGKIKIKQIDFVGNEVFSKSRLRRVLKKTKKVKLYRPFGRKVIFNELSWDEDRDNLRTFYLNHSYKDIKIGEPDIELTAKRPDAKTLKGKKYRMKITIPLEEGESYTLGSLKVEGVKIFDAKKLTKLFASEPGARYSYKNIDNGMEVLRNFYHNRGYIYAYTNQVLNDREDEENVVDVVIDVFEGDRFRLGRLEFKGNTKTNDKVLRREFRLYEGQWMSMGIFRASVFKVNALGYFKLEEDPLEFDFDDENKLVNVLVKGREVGRNDIQFGAGYSELDGFFGQISFNTRNFMGRGESLGVSLQAGGRSDYYTLSFTEPYFLDRRILLGGSVFSTNVDIADFYRETKGGSITVGLGLGTFSSLSALLAHENVYSRFAVARSGFPGTPTSGHQRPIEPPPLTGRTRELSYEVFEGKTTSLTPAFAFDSRDDPFDPNRGTRFSLRARFAGGPLGGDFTYVRPELRLSMFNPLRKKMVFAYNFEGGQFFPYDDSQIPLYARYRLGGERSLRGIPYYTVVPRTEDGEYFLTEAGSRIGGDRYWLLNVELQYRIGGPVKVVFFTDLGNTYHEDQGWEPSLFRKTTGVELRIFMPIFQAPLRFIYGYNLDPFPDEDRSDFQFSIGTTF
jgi:outer membrane protein insertion porin family